MPSGAGVGQQHGDGRPRDRWASVWAGIGLLLLGCGAYAPSFAGQFVFDDHPAIVANSSLDAWATGIAAARTSSRWLGDLTFLANVQWFGRDPVGFHAVNLAIHLVTGLALFALVRWTLLRTQFTWSAPPWNVAAEQHSRWCLALAFAIAALWTVHPLTTQGVTYIVQRYEQLAACWSVLALWCYAWGSERRRPWLWNGLAAGCVMLALGSKQTGIGAPVLAALYERVFFQDSWGTRCRRRGAFYLLCLPLMGFALSGVVPSSLPVASTPASRVEASGTLTSARLVENEDFAGFDYQAVSSWEYLRSQGNVLCHYVGLAAVPWRLCFDYAWPVAETASEWLPGFTAVGLVFVMGVALWCRGSPWGFLILGPYICLGPTSSIVPIRDLAVEHRVYLALAFWMALFVIGGAWIIARTTINARQRTRRQAAILAVLLTAATFRTAFRNMDYANEARLWQRATESAPQNARAYYNWGHSLLRDGFAAEAVAPLQRAIELNKLPQNQRFITANELAQNHNRLGTAWHQSGDIAAALREYDLAVGYDPGSGIIYHNRANARAIAGEFVAAAADYVKAAELLPKDAQVRCDYGNLFAQQQRHAEAVTEYTAALDRNPQLIDALIHRGTIQIEAGQLEAGYRDLRAAQQALPRQDPRLANVQQWLQVIETLPAPDRE